LSRFQLRYSPSTQNELHVVPRKSVVTKRLELSAGSYELERVPFSRAGERKELLEGLRSDVDGAVRPVSIILDEEQIVSQVVFGCGIGIALEEFCELTNIADIGLLRALTSAVKLESLLEAKEDGRQRFFVDRHDETP
jgi:hypothetical protein